MSLHLSFILMFIGYVLSVQCTDYSYLVAAAVLHSTRKFYASLVSRPLAGLHVVDPQIFIALTRKSPGQHHSSARSFTRRDYRRPKFSQ